MNSETVKKALANQYPKAAIKKAEKLTKGSDISCEVVVKYGKKKLEPAFDAAGKSAVKTRKKD